MSKDAAEKQMRVVTERLLASKQWVWTEHDDEPDPPVATGPPLRVPGFSSHERWVLAENIRGEV
jgi:hypothetical protein